MLALRLPVGLKILLLLHTAQSFVLLTANIDDVKKLAMKFVSESFADKIASFVGRAAQRVINQVSGEISKDSRDVSEENKQYKHAVSSEEIDKLEEIKPTKASLKEVFNPGEVDSKYGLKTQPQQYAPVRPKGEHRTKNNSTEKQWHNEKELHKTELKKKRKHKQRNKNVEQDYAKNTDYNDHQKYDKNTDQDGDNGKYYNNVHEKHTIHEKHKVHENLNVHEKHNTHKYKSHYLNLDDKSKEINRIDENNRNQDSQYIVTYRANDLEGAEGAGRRLPIVVLATSGGIMLTKVSTEKSLSIYGKKTDV